MAHNMKPHYKQNATTAQHRVQKWDGIWNRYEIGNLLHIILWLVKGTKKNLLLNHTGTAPVAGKSSQILFSSNKNDAIM